MWGWSQHDNHEATRETISFAYKVLFNKKALRSLQAITKPLKQSIFSVVAHLTKFCWEQPTVIDLPFYIK